MSARRSRSMITVVVLAVIAALGTSLPVARAADPSELSRLVAAGSRPSAGPSPLQRRLAVLRSADSHASGPGGGSRVRIPGAAGLAIDRRTRTVYVVGEPGGSRVRVIDQRDCTARHPHCRPPVATIDVGAAIEELAVDRASGTLYATLPDVGAVAVVDVRRCSSRVTSGCATTPVRVPVGGLPLGIGLDRRTGTVYVGNGEDRVSVIDAVACRAGHTGGCAAPPARVVTGPSAIRILVDARRSTVYATHEDGDSVAVLDTRHCRRGDTAGCGQTPVSITVGAAPSGLVIDRATDTLYVSALGPETVVAVDAGTCNAVDSSGCARTDRPTAIAGVVPQFLAVDHRTRSLYAMDGFADVITLLDLRHCSAHDDTGCEQPRRAVATDGGPFAMRFDQATGSIYQTAHADSTLQVIDPLSCSSRRTVGCRHDAPMTRSGGYGLGIDPGVHTLYGSRPGAGTLQLTDTRACRVDSPSGCRTAPTEVPAGTVPLDIQVDPGAHALYLNDFEEANLRIYDTRRCNVENPSGCTPAVTVPLGAAATNIGVNPRTHTVYATDSGGKRMFVLTRCGLTGCSTAPREVALGVNAGFPFVETTTDTVYLPTTADDGAGSLTLIDGAACDRGASGCGVIATTKVGNVPVGVDADPATHTVYVANGQDGDRPGTTSMVDLRTCSRISTAGCTTAWPVAPAPHFAFGVTVDRATHHLFVTSLAGAVVAVTDVRHCNVGDRSGCPRRPLLVATGYVTAVTRIDPLRHTAYALNSFDQTASLIDTRHPCRFGGCFRR